MGLVSTLLGSRQGLNWHFNGPSPEAPMERIGNDGSRIDGLKGNGKIVNVGAALPHDRAEEKGGTATVVEDAALVLNEVSSNRTTSMNDTARRRRRSLWYQNITSLVGYKNVRQCYVKENPLVALRWNATTKRYQVVPDAPSTSNATIQNTTATRLLGSFSARRREQDQTQTAIDSSSQISGANDTVVVYGRQCQCVTDLLPNSRPYYCPDFVPICQVVLDDSSSATPFVIVTCNNSTSTLYAKYLFPMALFFFIVYFFLCLCSPKGLAARMYAKKRVCKRWKENDDRFEAGLHDELEWMLERQRTRHEMALAQRRRELQRQATQWPPPGPRGSNDADRSPEAGGASNQQNRQLDRVLVPGSTPFSALLLEISNREQERRRHEVELVPVRVTVAAEQPAMAAAAHVPSQSSAAAVDAANATMVLLKTRVYDGTSSATATTTNSTGDDNVATALDTSSRTDNGDEAERGRGDATTCSICLNDLAVGDRVGDLPCKHLFHTACLKDWIKRRHRRCPLCMAVIPLVPKTDQPPSPIVPLEPPEAALVATVDPPLTHSPPVPASRIA